MGTAANGRQTQVQVRKIYQLGNFIQEAQNKMKVFRVSEWAVRAVTSAQLGYLWLFTTHVDGKIGAKKTSTTGIVQDTVKNRYLV